MNGRLPWVLAALGGLGLLVLGAYRPGQSRLWGDEPTYVAMAASLAAERDLRFDVSDLAREERAGRTGREALILQRIAVAGSPPAEREALAYSKPILYPLLAAPFFAVAGTAGMVALNALALLGALALALGHLARLGARPRASLTLVTFAIASPLLPCVLWRMGEALEAACVLAGLLLCLGEGTGGPRRVALRVLAGGALLGAATSMRFPNALLAAAAIAAALLARRWRRALGVAAAAALTVGLLGLASERLTGSFSPHRAVRSAFNRDTGYPVGADAGRARVRFDSERATSELGLRPTLDLGRTAYSSLYFLIGRHTGIAVYFPLALLLAAHAARRGRGRRLLLGAVAAHATFYLIWKPDNWFGGETFLGNRYFLAAYPALLVALKTLPGPRLLAAAWVVAALAFGSALSSLSGLEGRDRTSQSHARSGLFRWLPYESTAREIDGREDLYWWEEFVRFVDPFAAVSASGFRLAAGAPPAELLVVNRREDGVLRFLVRSQTPGVEIEIGDWARRQVLRPDPVPGGVRAVVSFQPAPAWRRHAFWWAPGVVYRARTVRIGLRAPGAGEAAADLVYLGDGKAIEAGFAREVMGVELPVRAVAGASAVVAVRLRNTSGAAWSSTDPLPVHLGYRLQPLEAGGAKPVEGLRTRLARAVNPGETLEATLEVRWPQRPGRYRLEIDLVREEIAWFATRVGAPVALGEVEVGGAASR